MMIRALILSYQHQSDMKVTLQQTINNIDLNDSQVNTKFSVEAWLFSCCEMMIYTK